MRIKNNNPHDWWVGKLRIMKIWKNSQWELMLQKIKEKRENNKRTHVIGGYQSKPPRITRIKELKEKLY